MHPELHQLRHRERRPWFERDVAVQRTRCGNAGRLGSYAHHCVLRGGGAAAFALGKQIANQEHDGKCHKTFEYGIVGNHKISPWVE